MLITKEDLYAILGRVVAWGIVIGVISWAIYQYGLYDGKEIGYAKGYIDGYFLLRPTSPNLPSEERDRIQKHLPIVPPPQVKPQVNPKTGTLI